MKAVTILFGASLVLSGPVFAQTTTTTETTRTTPNGAMVEKNSRTTEHLDGSVTTDRSKTVTRPDSTDTTSDSTTVITR
jgi:hypothetical protein